MVAEPVLDPGVELGRRGRLLAQEAEGEEHLLDLLLGRRVEQVVEHAHVVVEVPEVEALRQHLHELDAPVLELRPLAPGVAHQRAEPDGDGGQLGLADGHLVVAEAEPEEHQQGEQPERRGQLGDQDDDPADEGGHADGQLVHRPHPHLGVGQDHLQVRPGHVLEELDDGRARLEGQIGPTLGLEVLGLPVLHVDQHPVARGEGHLPAPQAEPGPDLLGALAEAPAVEDDLLEVVEVDLQAHPQQRLRLEGVVEAGCGHPLVVGRLGHLLAPRRRGSAGTRPAPRRSRSAPRGGRCRGRRGRTPRRCARCAPGARGGPWPRRCGRRPGTPPDRETRRPGGRPGRCGGRGSTVRRGTSLSP